MRLWTAIQGWAALVGVAIGLGAIGLTRQELHQDRGGQFIILAILLAFVATVVLLADAIYLGSGPVSRAWSNRRRGTLQLGRLDYEPEFNRASTIVAESIKRVNAAMAVVAPKDERAGTANQERTGRDEATGHGHCHSGGNGYVQ